MKVWNKIIEYGLYSLVFLLPWQTRWIIKAGKTEYGTFSLYGTDILLFAILLLFVILKFRNSVKGPNPEASGSGPGISKIWWAVATLDLFVFISIFFADDKWLALYKYGWFLLGVGLFWLVASANYNKIKLL